MVRSATPCLALIAELLEINGFSRIILSADATGEKVTQLQLPVHLVPWREQRAG
jgi:serine kinase of HPr protein (carbohydrate metabolism regulator)